MDFDCTPPQRGDGLPVLLLLPTSTWQWSGGRAETEREAGKSGPCAGCSPWWCLDIALEPPDVFVMSAQRQSAAVQFKSLHSTFCLCRVMVLHFKSGKEQGKDGQESAEGRIHLAWRGVFVRFFKKTFLILCAPAHELSVALLAVPKGLASLFWWVKDEEHVPAQWVAAAT